MGTTCSRRTLSFFISALHRFHKIVDQAARVMCCRGEVVDLGKSWLPRWRRLSSLGGGKLAAGVLAPSPSTFPIQKVPLRCSPSSSPVSHASCLCPPSLPPTCRPMSAERGCLSGVPTTISRHASSLQPPTSKSQPGISSATHAD